MKHGFTLIELLVVVLIIGILAAVALPQYQKAVEKARMTEAVMIVRAIANANQLFYISEGRYLRSNEIDLLDISVPGEVQENGRIATKDFIYAPSNDAATMLAIAQRKPLYSYFISIYREEKDRIRCGMNGAETYTPTKIQKELCQQLNNNGTL